MKTLLPALAFFALLPFGAPTFPPALDAGQAVKVAHNPDGGGKKKDDEEGEEDCAPAAPGSAVPV